MKVASKPIITIQHMMLAGMGRIIDGLCGQIVPTARLVRCDQKRASATSGLSRMNLSEADTRSSETELRRTPPKAII